MLPACTAAPPGEAADAVNPPGGAKQQPSSRTLRERLDQADEDLVRVQKELQEVTDLWKACKADDPSQQDRRRELASYRKELAAEKQQLLALQASLVPLVASAEAEAVTAVQAAGERMPVWAVDMKSSIDAALAPIATLASAVAHQAAVKYKYSKHNASRSCREDDGFRKRLEAYYDNNEDDRQQIRCMFLDTMLPRTFVRGAHLFKHTWRDDCDFMMGFTDINDVRNGLLLSRVMEEPFDDSRLCFEYVRGDFNMVLLDPSLRDKKLVVVARELAGKTCNMSQLEQAFGESTYGDWEGRCLQFSSSSVSARPYKRCLSFQAQQAAKGAVKEGWISGQYAERFNLSYMAESLGESRVADWLNQAKMAINETPGSDTGTDSEVA